MSVIRTVLGDVSPQDWGVTNAHAHLVGDLYSHHGDPRYADYVLAAADTLPELAEFKDAGGRALVECTPIDLGRAPAQLRELADASGVHVVMGTGIYHEAFHPPAVATMLDTDIRDLFVAEITEGADATGVRAGVIGEIGTYQDAISDAEQKVFRAAAWAAIETGAAVTTHTYVGQLALAQIELLTAEGLPPGRIVIGHLDDRSPIDVDLCRAIAERGAVVQFDAVGCDYFTETLGAQMPSDVERLRAAAQLVAAGFAGQIILASDICRRRHLRMHAGPGLVYLAGEFRQLAAAEEFPADVLHQLLVDNPRRLLTLAATAGEPR